MKTIIESYNQRQLDILDILYSKKDWTTIKNIATVLNVTEQTINNDLKKIADIGQENFIIETSLKLGISVPELDAQTLTSLKSSILKNATSIKFILSIFNNPYENLNFHADKLYTSRSTLHRYLGTLNTKLDRYNLSILQDNGGLFLFSENESDLRRFLSILLNETFDFNNKNFIDPDLLIYIEQRIQKMITNSNFINTNDHIIYLQNLYFVSLIRNSQNFSLPSITFNFNYQLDKHDFKEKELSANSMTLPSTTLINAEITNSTLIDIENFIFSNSLTHTSTLDEENNLQIIDGFISDIFTKNNMKPNEERVTFFISSINKLFFNKINSVIPNFLIIDPYQTFATEVKRNYPDIFRLTLQYINHLEANIHAELHSNINEIIHTLFISFPEIMDISYKGNVSIISSHSAEHANFLKKLVCNRIDINTNFSHFITSMSEQDFQLPKQTKLIITNSINIYQNEANAILVSDYPSNKELSDVKVKLKECCVYRNEI
ncbi:HTH domain-containing protein [Vagococcus carniphilus]|uniref:HTH domain-containing protein n=1 Tax=Vagococcus carniphilus TaxID=218144 RepID=A0A430B6F6_9ENTE|nr:HTH domain-containing protein [Vagococcus carniphilus]QNN72779.1 HTH domain-containing protein [Vagococcus carniphilus]RSU15883.1 hypothetical protein CBF28_05465 [Vagococcus carniphilus]